MAANCNTFCKDGGVHEIGYHWTASHSNGTHVRDVVGVDSDRSTIVWTQGVLSVDRASCHSLANYR